MISLRFSRTMSLLPVIRSSFCDANKVSSFVEPMMSSDGEIRNGLISKQSQSAVQSFGFCPELIFTKIFWRKVLLMHVYKLHLQAPRTSRTISYSYRQYLGRNHTCSENWHSLTYKKFHQLIVQSRWQLEHFYWLSIFPSWDKFWYYCCSLWFLGLLSLRLGVLMYEINRGFAALLLNEFCHQVTSFCSNYRTQVGVFLFVFLLLLLLNV